MKQEANAFNPLAPALAVGAGAGAVYFRGGGNETQSAPVALDETSQEPEPVAAAVWYKHAEDSQEVIAR